MAKRLPFISLFSILLLSLALSACGGGASTEKTSASKKANWISHALGAIEANHYPKIKGIAWWNENFDNARLRVDSSPQSLSTYKRIIASNYFKDQLQFSNNKLIPPASGVYHGAFPDFGGEESMVTAKRITDYEALIGKQIAWAYFSDNWLDNLSFPYDEVTVIHNAGRVPFIRMMARSDFEEAGVDPVYAMQKIIDGDFDIQLNAWALEAKNIGFPLLVEFGTEANGNWFPWNGEHNGAGVKDQYGDPLLADGPERFRDAYRHIIDIFKAQSVNNITWFFHIDAHSEPDVAWNSIENYYPGDDYIDWFGVSVYGPQLPSEGYESFTDILDEIYPKLISLGDKPIAVLEFAITEVP